MIEKKPFVTYTLDEDKKKQKSRTLTIRINEDEEVMLKYARDKLGIENDGRALKVLSVLGTNVLHRQFIGLNVQLYLNTKELSKVIKQEILSKT